MNRKRTLIGWTLSIFGLAALVIFAACSGIFTHALYTGYSAKLVNHFGNHIPGHELGDAIRAMSYSARDIPRWLAVLSSFLLIAGWMIAGSPANQLTDSIIKRHYQIIVYLRFLASILLGVGIIWLLYSALMISVYTVQASYDIWMDFTRSDNSPLSQADTFTILRGFALDAGRHYNPMFLPPVAILAIAHAMAASLWWRGRGKKPCQAD